MWWHKPPESTSTERLKDQGANTSTLIVPCELAANMVGLSLFQHTALMKCGDKSSSLSSGFAEPNLCQAAGFEIACSPKPKKIKMLVTTHICQELCILWMLIHSNLPDAISIQILDEVEKPRQIINLQVMLKQHGIPCDTQRPHLSHCHMQCIHCWQSAPQSFSHLYGLAAFVSANPNLTMSTLNKHGDFSIWLNTSWQLCMKRHRRPSQAECYDV